MIENDLHLTKSHLLRRILQQQVERLEAEKADLQTEVARLEQGLVHSRDSEDGASVDSAVTELQTLVEETLASIRAISEQARREATFTLKVTRHEQERVLEEMASLLQEGERLRELLLEAMEGVHSIDEQGQSHTALMVKEAHLQQERFIIEVRSLHHGRSSEAALAQKRHKIASLRERAQAEAERVKLDAHLAREKMVKEIRLLHEESQKLRGAVGRALDHAHTLSEGIYVGASHAVQPNESAQAKTPSTVRVPQTSTALPEPPPPPKRHPLQGLLVTMLFAFLLGLTALRGVEELPGTSKDFLLDYRYMIWIVGGAITYWLLTNLNGWEHQARTGKWLAERDYAIWWVWRARIALVLLIPLLTLT
ncbi:MAG: hypothetical protein H0T73_04525, partial [Ardenticatenales bacterium]|nr:hypothetical protein [Ardenticatenales bacterium]